ncbi:MAG: MliC family protein [Burkholderiales bacterium]
MQHAATRNLSSPPGIALRTGGETRTLPQARAASGVRYQDAVMQFWTEGDSARFERQPGSTVDCREIRSLSLPEDARVRGVTFRGVGNEPGWRLEIGPAHRVLFEDGYGSMSVVFSPCRSCLKPLRALPSTKAHRAATA